jgi:hypothetical protein
MLTRSPSRIATIFRPASGNAALIALGVGLPKHVRVDRADEQDVVIPGADLRIGRVLNLRPPPSRSRVA